MPTTMPDGAIVDDNGIVIGYADQPTRGGTIMRKPVESPKPREAPSGYEWAGNGSLRPIKGGPNDPNAKPIKQGTDPEGTAKQRGDALRDYRSASELDARIAEIEQLYADGPGSTTGLSGLQDFLPTEQNDNFNKAGLSVKPLIKSALGFTGGEGNTATEIQLNYGPYVPEAGDYDSSILGKIERLKSISQAAKDRSIQMLGGIPNANGVVVPLSDGRNIAPQQRNELPVVNNGVDRTTPYVGDPNQQAAMSLATGQTKDEPNREASAALNTLIRAGKTPQEINAYLGSIGAQQVDPQAITQAQAYLRTPQGRKFRESIGNVTRTVPTSASERFGASGLGAMVTGAATGALAGYNDEAKAALQTGFGTMGDYGQARDAANMEKALIQQNNPDMALAGNVFGGIGANIGAGAVLGRIGPLAAIAAKYPLASGMGGNVAYGAAVGSGEENQNRIGGAALGATGALAGDALFRGGSKLLGGLGAGVTAPAARRLGAQNIPMSFGQIMRDRGGYLGKAIALAEDASTSTPFAGDLIAHARDNSLLGANRVAFNQAGSPIGAQVDNIGTEGVAGLNAARGQAYDSALDRMDLNLDPNAASRMGPTIANRMNLAPDEQARFLPLMQQVAGRVAPSGPTSGRTVQGMKQIMRTESRLLKNQPGSQFVREAIGNADSALMNEAARQQPDAFAAYQAADLMNGRFKTLSDAVGRASGNPGVPGVFSGAQLAASLKSAKVTNDTRGAFGQLADDMVRVLPSKLADSGTPRRMMQGGVATGLLGLGALNTGAGAIAASIPALLAVLSAPGVRPLVQATLIGNRGKAATAIGNGFKKNSGRAGQIGSAAAIPYLLQGN